MIFFKQNAIKHLFYGVLLLLVIELLTACIPVAVGVVSVTAVNLAPDKRTAGRIIDDNSLEFQLREVYSKDEQLGSAVNISVTTVNGIVLLTGEVQTDQQRQHAEALTEQFVSTRKVRKVINDLALSGKTNLTSRMNDAYITSKVKFKLIRADNVSARRVKIVTEHSNVYLLGLVTPTEAEVAVDIAKSVRGVARIIKVFEYTEQP